MAPSGKDGKNDPRTTLTAKRRGGKDNNESGKEKKNGKAKSKGKAKNKEKPKGKSGGRKSGLPLFPVVKWLFVLFLWALIGIGVLVAWYARDLNEITSTPQFERKTSITLKAADGSTIARYGELKSIAVPLNKLPSELIYAVMATEDRRFYQHFGIDPLGIARAAVRNVIRGGVVQGGSTITQQLAKNLFLSHDRTFRRKIQEVLLAFWLEHELTKDEILTAYLNRIYFGSGAYGVEAASRIYFGKSASNLNLKECAMLAGVIKAPSRYSPLNNPKLAHQRMDIVLSAMRDAGYLTGRQDNPGSAIEIADIARTETRSAKEARYFADYVIDQIDDLIGTPSEDIIVETTLIPEIQNSAEASLEAALELYGESRNAHQGAVLAMHRDGAIVAMIGGRNYGKSQFNRATQARRPPGSAFKTIVFLAALEGGWRPSDMIEDVPITSGSYRPANFDNKYYGEVTLEEALSRSLNSATVKLARYVGINKVVELARSLGIEADLKKDMSLALGSSGVPMIEIVQAYGVLANKGYRVKPFAITRITDNQGQLYYERNRKDEGRQVINPKTAGEITYMLTEAVERGTGKNARLPDTRAAGKTGTSQDYRDAWFAGYSGDYVAAVWIGNDDNSPTNGVTGGSIPAQIWKDIMLTAINVRPPEPLLSETPPSQGFSSILSRLLSSSTSGERPARGYNN